MICFSARTSRLGFKMFHSGIYCISWMICNPPAYSNSLYISHGRFYVYRHKIGKGESMAIFGFWKELGKKTKKNDSNVRSCMENIKENRM